MNNTLKFIDLFAGIGAFHLAMNEFNGECVLASEIDKYAIDTYKTNFHIDSNNNICDIDEKNIPNHDVLCAGFPCQSFSIAGKGLGFKDKTRGTLFFDIARILKEKQPKFIILENVKNLVVHDNGNTYRVIKETLEELDYVLTKEPIIMSPIQIGVPQNRERVFILGVHKKYCTKEYLDINIPDKQNTSVYTILEDKVDDKYNITNYEDRIFTAWNEFHINIPNHYGVVWVNEFGKTYDYSNEAKWKQKYIEKNRKLYLDNQEFIDNWIIKYDVNNFKLRDKKFEWQAGKEVESIWDTVIQLRQSGIRCKKPDSFQTLVAIVQTPIVAKYKRRITPREAARLQSFPDSFILNPNESKAYKQLGNSANVEVIKYLLNELLRNVL